MSRLVILGRDGVINRYLAQSVSSPDAFEPLPGSLEAIARLNHAGLKVAVATNQPGIASGLFDLDALNAVHARMHQMLGRVGGHIDGIFVCPHAPDAGCDCHKPAPGLLLTIGARFSAPLQSVPVIGRGAADVSAARQVEAIPILIDTEGPAEDQADLHAIPRFKDLSQAVEHMLTNRS